MGLMAVLYATFSWPTKKKSVAVSIYDFKLTDINGVEIDFQQYKGKKILIVNTASKCGYTPQYSDLERLHQIYSGSLSVLGFPSNDFLWQEPGTNDKIISFCKKKFGVTFTMFSKISVRGRSQHPLYQWLESKTGKSPSWNFCKYVVSDDGSAVKFFGPRIKPLDPVITRELSPEPL
jgi:glutathione peroxidase